MGWRRSPAFLALWLLILLYLSLLQILAGAGAASEPTLNSLADLVAVLNFLFITPAVAALACLSSLSGEPLAAFLLALPTYLLSWAGVFPLRCAFHPCARPALRLYGVAGLILGVVWASGASAMASSEDPRGWKSALGLGLILSGWAYPILLFLANY